MDDLPTSAGHQTFEHGRYEVVEVIRDSPRGRVCMANDIKDDTRVIIKTIRPHGELEPLLRTMYRREVEVLSSLHHASVIKLHRHFTEASTGELCLVLEHLHGSKSLDHLLQNRPPHFSWRVKVLRSVLDGLAYAHARGIVHRDLTPANIVVQDAEEIVKIIDFGAAKRLISVAEPLSHEQPYMRSLKDWYTRPYAAPEQRLHHVAGVSADRYAFGVLCAAVFAWRLPPEALMRDGLPEFLEDFRNDIRYKATAQHILPFLKDLMVDEVDSRPDWNEVRAFLSSLMRENAERAKVTLRQGAKFRQALTDRDITASIILKDFGQAVTGRYETYRRADSIEESFKIILYGSTFQVELHPEDQGGLVATRLLLVPKTVHENAKRNAETVAFDFQFGPVASPAEPLIEALELHRQEMERRALEVGKREEFLKPARYMLAFELASLKGARVSYERISAKGKRSKIPPTQRMSKGQTVKVKLSKVLPHGIDDVDASLNGAPPTLQDPFQGMPASQFNVLTDHEQGAIGRVTSYDPVTQTMTIQLHRHATVARTDSWRLIDNQSFVPLKRQTRALDDFVRGTTVNPQLARRLMLPGTNDLSEPWQGELIQQHLQDPDVIGDVVGRALAAHDVFLIQGPPGTGKTTVISEIVAQILKGDPLARVLITSQSNDAVDNALERLDGISGGRRQVRFTTEARGVPQGQTGFTEGFEVWRGDLHQRAQAALDAFVPEEGEQAPLVLEALQAWTARIDTNADLIQEYADDVSVYGATCSRAGALTQYLRDQRFDWVIVDEAARATTAELLVPLVLGRQFVLVGDHRQLPPVLTDARIEGLKAAGLTERDGQTSLFETLFQHVPERNKASLTVQRRMHPSIGQLVGDLFYDEIGGLQSAVTHQDRPLPFIKYAGHDRVFWVDEPGSRNRDKFGSSFNVKEISVILSLLERLDSEISQTSRNCPIGIISAYRAQIHRLRSSVSEFQNSLTHLDVQIGTVDSFQGRERDVIIYSLVGEGRFTEFVADPRRLNVAFSRARSLLIVVGDYQAALRTPGTAQLARKIRPANILKQGTL